MAETRRRPIQSYEDIEAYQRAKTLIPAVHKIADALPDREQRDLASQIRRAAKSIPANIAEGFARRASAKEFKRYLTIAMGSANELEVHLKIAANLGYVTKEVSSECKEEYVIVGKQLNRLIASWQTFESPASSIQAPE